MTDTLRLSADATSPTEPDGRSFDFVASTESENTHGFKIAAEGWDLARYKANPVVLLSHGRELEAVIGQASDVRVESGKLIARVTLVSESANPRAEMARKLLAEGALRAMSAGFRALEVTVIDDILVVTKAELLELSIVPVPSDPDALRASARAALVQLAASFGGTTSLKTEKRRMDFSKILGLADGAPAEAQATEIVRLRGGEAQILAATGVKSIGEAVGALEGFKQAAAGGRAAEIELAAYREATAKAEHERSVDAALADGRLNPAQRAWAISLSADVLKGFLVTVQPARTEPTKTTVPDVSGLAATELALCAEKKWDPKEYAATKARMSAVHGKGA